MTIVKNLDKRYLFKTAYSPLFDVYVSIDHVHVDDMGQFIFTCSSQYHTDQDRRLTGHLFREHELKNFVL